MGLWMLMSLAGGGVMLVYCLALFLFGGSWSAQGRERMLKTALFLFLCPLQKIKYVFPGRMMEKLPRLYAAWENKRTASDSAPVYWTHPYAGDGSYALLEHWQAALAAAGIMFAAVFVIYQIRRYVHLKKTLYRCSADVTEELREILADWPMFQTILKKKTRVRRSAAVRSPFTIGILRPRIFLPEMHLTQEELGMICCHEAVHIKKRDAAVKCVCLVAVLLHCLNPFSYLLLLEFARVCELRCDQEVLKQVGEEKRSAYAKLVIQSAAWTGQKAGLCTSGYAAGKRELYGRVRTIMRREKNKKGITVMAALLAAFCGCATICAYQTDGKESGSRIPSETGSVPASEAYDFFDSDFVFTVYQMEAGASVAEAKIEMSSVCAHTNQMIGEIREHQREENGCTVQTYECRRCVNCGYLEIGKQIASKRYAPCSHKQKEDGKRQE